MLRCCTESALLGGNLHLQSVPPLTDPSSIMNYKTIMQFNPSLLLVLVYLFLREISQENKKIVNWLHYHYLN